MKRLILSVAFAGLGAAGAVLAQQTAAPAVAPQATTPDIASRIEQVESADTAEKIARGMLARGDLANATLAWQRAVKLRPHLGRYKLELAATYALQDRKSETYNALLELQAQGYAFDLSGDKRFEKVSTTEVWTYTLQGFDANRVAFGDVSRAYEIPRELELVESLAWDASRGEMLVGSAREGKVYRIGRDGKPVAFVHADDENGMWAVFDLAVDAERGVLWVASTAVPHYRGYDAESDLGRAGVFKFDLKSGKFLKKFLSPSIAGQSFFLSTLALGPDGAVYAADGVNNAVYMVRDDQFRRLFHAPRLDSIRGIAVSDDGKSLFLGDHERGLIGYDLAAGKPFDIGVPKTLALGGIDGVSYWNDHLIVVQNGMQPTRVMRLKLAADRRSIAAVQPVAANQPDMSLPTLGTLDGATFYFLANSQKGKYDRFGLPRDKEALEAARILKVKVDAEQQAEPNRPNIVG